MTQTKDIIDTITNTESISSLQMALNRAINNDITTIDSNLTTHESAATAHANIRGVANGLATLDINGKIPLSQINDDLLGNVTYKGLWDASTNTPHLGYDTTPLPNGNYYITSKAGTFDGVDYQVGDWIIATDNRWLKVDNTDAVSSVEGRTGNVTVINDSSTTGATSYTWSADKLTTQFAGKVSTSSDTNVLYATNASGEQTTLTVGTGLSIDNGQLINSKSDPTVDQTYDSTSANAQSGVAIAGAGFVTTTDLATVATSGDYDDLTNKPTIPTVNNSTITFMQGDISRGTITLNQSNDATITFSSGQTQVAWDDISNKPSFATVATTGDYDDLTNKPTIPSATSQLVNDSNFVTTTDLATVATTGDYDDLTNKPTIPSSTSQLVNDSNFVTTTDLATVATSGDYNDLTNKPTEIPDQTSQSGKFLTTDGTDVSWASVTADTEVEWATFGTTTYQQISDWNTAGKVVYCKYGNNIFTLSHIGLIYHSFSNIIDFNTLSLRVNTSSVWECITNLAQSQLPAGTAGQVLTYTGTAGTVGSATINDIVPSQTGQNGKFLTTDGTTASWGTLPTATDSTNGVTKIYSTTGVNTDGTMTQASITSAITSAGGAKVIFRDW